MDYGQVTAAYPTNNSPYTQVVSAQAKSGTFTLANPANSGVTAFLSSNYSGNPAVNEDVPLGPGGSVVLDGTQDTFVYTAVPGTSVALYKLPSGVQYNSGSITIEGTVEATVTGDVVVTNTPTVDVGNSPTVNVGTVSGSIDIASVAGSVNVAGAVNATGVGGFINPGQIGNLFNAGGSTVAAGVTSNISGSVNVANYTSIVLSAINLVNSSAAAGAAVCAIFHITWFDSIGDETCVDTVSMLLGANVGPTWEIPVRGSTCTLTVQNIGSVGTITIPAGNVILDGSYRNIPNVRVTQGFIGAPLPTFTGCTAVLQSNPVFQVAAWIAAINYTWAGAVTNVVFPLPQWAGTVTGFYQVITTALARNATIIDLTYAVQGGVVSGSGYANGLIQNIPGAIDTNPVPISFNLPPTQCALMLDTPAAVGEFFLSLVGVGNLYIGLDNHAMTKFEILSLLVSIVGVMMIPLVRAALKALVKSTQNEVILTELIRETREDRRATNDRLTWLEQNLWDQVKNGPRSRR